MRKLIILCISIALLAVSTGTVGAMSGVLFGSGFVYATDLNFTHATISHEIGTEVDFAELNPLILNPADYSGNVSYTGFETVASQMPNGKFYLDKVGSASITAKVSSSYNTYITNSFVLSVYDNASYASEISFSVNSVELKLNDKPSSASAILSIVGENETAPDITFNSNVISYDVNTGLINAVGVGSTILTATVKSSFLGTISAYCTVNVTNTDFAPTVTLDSDYVLKLTKPNKEPDKLPVHNKITYKSSNEEVFTESNGALIAIGLGEATLTMEAIVGYNASTDSYNKVTANARVVVEREVTGVEIVLCDSEFNALLRIDEKFVLHSGLKADKEHEVYYLKVTTNVACEPKQVELFSGMANVSLLDVESIGSAPTTYYAIRATGAGETQITINFLDVAYNYSAGIHSNTLNVEVVPFVAELKLLPVVELAGGDKEITKNLSGYKLFMMGVEPAIVVKAQSEGISNTCVIKWANPIKYACIDALVSEVTVLNLTIGDDNTFLITALKDGEAEITFSALDGSGVTISLSFVVESVPCFDAEFAYAAEEYTLTIGLSDALNLAPLSVMPYYGIKDTAYEILDATNLDYISISESGVLSATKIGVILLRVSINPLVYADYEITIVNDSETIELSAESVMIEIDEGVTINYVIYAPDGALAANQSVALECVDMDGNPLAASSAIRVQCASNLITISNRTLGAGQQIVVRFKYEVSAGIVAYSSALTIIGA